MIRAVVIGAGYLGAFHAQKYAQLQKAGHAVELAAVIDTDLRRAKEVAAPLGAQAFSRWQEAAAHSSLDAASIVAPTPLHFAVARECLQAGLHILVEKPVTESLAEADELIALAQTQRRVFQVGHILRFDPVIAQARQLGWLSPAPLFIEIHRLAGFKLRGTQVNVVLDLMIHDIDIALHLNGDSPLVDLRANGAAVLTRGADIASARLEFANGCVANLTASRISAVPMRKIRLFQQQAYLSMDSQSRQLMRACVSPTPGADGAPQIQTQQHTAAAGDGLLEEIRAFIEAIDSGGAAAVGGDEGRRALEVALRVNAAIAARSQEHSSDSSR